MIASFDVFDTVLTRVVTNPTSVWLLLGRRLAANELIDFSPEAFMRMRRSAQERIHHNARWGEFTLRQVYAELGGNLGLDEESIARWVEEEYRLEAELLRGVPGIHTLVEEMRGRGHRIVYLSDMYLEAAFLREQLRLHGFFQQGDQCLVSCELGHPKRTGGAFRVMAELNGVEVSQIIHHGNSAEFDIRGGRRAGVRTRALFGANPTRFERALEGKVFDTEGLSAVMAGAARLTRLSGTGGSREEAVVRDIVAGVVAPALVGYVIWVLRRAEKLGLRRLHFVGDEGEVLLELARRLAPRLGA
jgi:predicted HAD superfamily hydrolase